MIILVPGRYRHLLGKEESTSKTRQAVRGQRGEQAKINEVSGVRTQVMDPESWAPISASSSSFSVIPPIFGRLVAHRGRCKEAFCPPEDAGAASGRCKEANCNQSVLATKKTSSVAILDPFGSTWLSAAMSAQPGARHLFAPGRNRPTLRPPLLCSRKQLHNSAPATSLLPDAVSHNHKKNHNFPTGTIQTSSPGAFSSSQRTLNHPRNVQQRQQRNNDKQTQRPPRRPRGRPLRCPLPCPLPE